MEGSNGKREITKIGVVYREARLMILHFLKNCLSVLKVIDAG